MSNEIKKNEFKDFVAFLDDCDQKREVWCKVLEVNSFIKFQLKTGKILIVPPNRVLKVKQEVEQQ